MSEKSLFKIQQTKFIASKMCGLNDKEYVDNLFENPDCYLEIDENCVIGM